MQRTPSRGIVERDFSIFEGMKKFYYRHSVKKCTNHPFDSRAYLKTVRRLWFPTSDRLETWLILSGTIRSKQWHESTMVWRNLPSHHLWQCLLPLCHAQLEEKDETKYQKRSYRGKLRQTMVDFVVLSRPGRSGGDQPGLEAIGGRQPKTAHS